MKAFSRFVFVVLAFWLTISSSYPARAQTLEYERKRGLLILEIIKKDIQKTYYDPTFRGKDLDALFRNAEEKVKQATSIGHVLSIIASAVMEFDDSHTYFIPPAPADHVQHGWEYQMIGDKCYVVAVKKGSDAEAKGLKPGDLILSLGGYLPTQENLWKLSFFLRSAYRMVVGIEKPDGKRQELEIMAKVRKGKPVLDLKSFNAGNDIGTIIRESENDAVLYRHRYAELDKNLFIWKMPHFDDEETVDKMMDKAKKSKTLILDLRGNGGGYEVGLLRLIGYFFDHDIKLGDLKTRKETKPLIARTLGGAIYKGELIVLVDSESASSSELFARVIQLEKRGTIIGDKTSGSVMQGTYSRYKSGVDLIFYYGLLVTSGDLIMADGKSLEKVGVLPDERLLPTPEDLAAGRDPVLSRAASLVGINLDSMAAGKMFPVEWRP